MDDPNRAARPHRPLGSITRMLATLRSVVRLRPLETDRIARRLERSVSIDDLRTFARRRLPRGVFDYIDGGAEDERTMARNTADFDEVRFRPRVLRDVGTVDVSSTLLGRPIPMPLILAPTGFTRIADAAGELAVARAAARAGLPYALSTLGTRSIEDVAGAGNDRLWFQVYVWRDRALVADMVARAAECGYEALVITVDTATLGRRERDVRRGFSLPPKIGLGTFVDGAMHPGWTWQLLRSEPIRFANVVGRGDVGDGASAVSLASYVNAQFDPTLSWRDVEWFRSIWNGPIVLKGVQGVDDARIAVEHGIEAVALSNHGGRQLDGAPSPVSLVGPVADAVGGDTEIICDGGIRRGSDMAKALALGATACMVGRPYLYGLAAAGERGVDHVIDHFREGLRRTMALLGVDAVSDVDRSLVSVAGS